MNCTLAVLAAALALGGDTPQPRDAPATLCPCGPACVCDHGIGCPCLCAAADKEEAPPLAQMTRVMYLTSSWGNRVMFVQCEGKWTPVGEGWRYDAQSNTWTRGEPLTSTPAYYAPQMYLMGGGGGSCGAGGCASCGSGVSFGRRR